MMVGGKGDSKPLSEKAQQLVQHHRAEIEAAAGGAGSMFEPVSMKTQVVAGTNYFVKIQTDADKFVHARIWHQLDNTSTLHSATTGHAAADEL